MEQRRWLQPREVDVQPKRKPEKKSRSARSDVVWRPLFEELILRLEQTSSKKTLHVPMIDPADSLRAFTGLRLLERKYLRPEEYRTGQEDAAIYFFLVRGELYVKRGVRWKDRQEYRFLNPPYRED